MTPASLGFSFLSYELKAFSPSHNNFALTNHGCTIIPIMTRELPPHDQSFTYDEQYRVAAWRATFRFLELLHQSPYIEDEPVAIPIAIRELAQVAFKDISEVVPFIKKVAKKQQPPYYNAFLLSRMINTQTNDTPYDLEHMASLYSNHDDSWQEIAASYGIERFDEDIETLAQYQHKRYLEALKSGNRDGAAMLATIQHDNDHYIGMWDTDRFLEDQF